MSVLVTGHAGFLGQHIGRGLSADGVVWWGLDRTPSESAPHQIICDIRAVHNVETLLPDLDLIIHLASPVGVAETGADHAATYAAIVESTHAVIRLARRTSAKLLYFSSSEVFGEAHQRIDHSTLLAPLSGYGRGKYAAEQLVAELAEDAVVVRPFNVYGPGQRSGFLVSNIVRQLQCNSTVRLVDGGRAVRQFTYVGDVVEAVQRIRQQWLLVRRTLHVAGPEAASVAEVVKIAERVTRRAIATSAVTAQELDRDPGVEILARTVVPDSIGGWVPTTTISQGLQLTFAITGHGASGVKSTEQ